MLRSVWNESTIDYQLVDIPIGLLQRMDGCTALEIGKRAGRRSLGFDVLDGDAILCHVHFDGADGKCQVRNLRIDRCIMLAEWRQEIAD